MNTQGKHDPEADSLRQTTRDLVAMTTLPAIWGDLPPAGVVESLAGVLLKTLDLDLAYIRLCGRGDIGEIEVVRSRHKGAEAQFLPAARTMLEGAQAARGEQATATMPDPAGGQVLRVSVTRFGISGEIGTILVASPRPGFPSENERLLLGVGANQATVVLQRHQAERALRRSESRFLDLADAAPAMLWVTEPDGNCSFLSRGWYEFTGQSEEEGLGIGWTSAIHPDDRTAATLAFQDANERKAEFSLEHRVLHVDGSYRWVIDAGRPRFAAAGNFLGFVGNVLDISDRKQTEQALHDTRNMLSAVFEALPVGVAVIDHAGALLLSNQEMHQYLPARVSPTLDEARYGRWQAFHEDGRPYSPQDFPGARALRGERVVPGIEARYTQDDGSEIWTQIAAVPLKDSADLPKGQVSIVTNIDAFKRTEAALRQAETRQRALFDEVAKSNRNLSEFLAVLAHELRNPLAPILTGLEIMRMRADSLDTVSNVRGIIERQVKQLSHLINDLLDIARVTNGKVEIKKEAVDLKVIVANAVETSLPLIEKGRHAFSMTLHDAPLPVHADATRIAQVVGNLLTNAAKYTPPGGQIALSVVRDGSEAIISVTDNGIGIPAESLESVFDMFSQVGRNMHHSQGGLGIGLALVRQLVSLHDGTVAACSEGAGKGSTFTVRLPLDSGKNARGPTLDASGAATGAGKRFRILVTDDNVDAALTLASLLELKGHDLRIAHDGQKALKIAGEFQPHVVFLDIGMPDMSGYEVAHRLRKIGGLERSTIVAVSGWGAKDDLARSKEAGFDKHFTKPVAPARLNELLDALPAHPVPD
ncbi:hybrid sensor histidine kinase/response regulator [Telluria aromaticivorans]|uniref:histidine kinase n=1 Tax=Telluria aromaticivorans TaxID=2725995 RepID=A0A7Y2JYU4_9BURK|nr:PAS domain S-box protein [Telluria aromaticivorans]NNG22908.1 PAS domain S-box protein [Telluria aromaticivorans]